MALPNTNIVQNAGLAVKRIRFFYALLIVIVALFGVRLFYVQVIRYDHYKNAALSDQLKEYQIPATRGIIEAHDGNQIVPIVLNQKLYTLFVDPTLVKNPQKVASAVAQIVGGHSDDYLSDIKTKNTRYVILAKRLTPAQSDKIMALQYPGLGTEEQDYRTYAQGQLGAQLLGFVNDEGVGKYGVEQALNQELKGTPGQLKAITDVRGVPLAASKDNIEQPAKAGNNVVLTINMGIQAQMEKILQDEAQKTKSKLLSAVIMDPNTGQIKAMANYPTYDPAHYQNVDDPSVFQDAAVSNAIEPGSIMKTLTTSAALDLGAVQPDTTFYDPAHWVVDGFNITDIEEDGGARQQSIASTLALSLNTGATWMLMQMGGGQISDKGNAAWYNYLHNKFQLGKPTNIEAGYESEGVVPKPNPNAPAIDLTYAETSFGQALQVTALQMAAALSSVVNGGTYYQPTLVDQTIDANGNVATNKPKVVANHVVSSKTGQELIPLMQNVVAHYRDTGFSYMNFDSHYLVGGKTGTAQIAEPGGAYYPDKFNGTYLGFVGGSSKPQYVIAVFNNQPTVDGYAGSRAGQPVFADLAHMLINDGYATPKQ